MITDEELELIIVKKRNKIKKIKEEIHSFMADVNPFAGFVPSFKGEKAKIEKLENQLEILEILAGKKNE